MEEHHFECQCGDFGHVFRFSYEPDDGDVYLTVQLNRWQGLWGRLQSAFRLVFLRPKGYADAHYDVTMLRDDDFPRLHALLDEAQARRHELYLQRSWADDGKFSTTAVLLTEAQRRGLGLPPTRATQCDPRQGDR